MRRTKNAWEIQWVPGRNLGIFKGMNIISKPQLDSKMAGPCALTLGNFDGLHRGHQKLLAEIKKHSKEKKLESVVFTFDPHPVSVLSPELGHLCLYPREDLKHLLLPWEVDHLVLQPFTKQLAKVSAEEFFEKYLVRAFQPAVIVVGENFCFGVNREGNASKLKQLCDQKNIELCVMSPVLFGGYPVSSSLIRQRVRMGDVRTADELLGHPYSVTGIVEKGAQRGGKLGFPTANLDLISDISPSPGVYITGCWIHGKWYPSVTNIGCNPTFSDKSGAAQPMTVETHVLNFCDDIYGENIRLEFYEKIRNEIRFNNIENLKAQIYADSETARVYFEDCHQ